MIKYLLPVMAFFSIQAKSEIIKIPENSGFSGVLLAGGGGISYKSNFYKGPNDDNSIHHGIGSEPEKHSGFVPLFGADLRYTFAETRTQLFLGTLTQDAIRFDFTQQAGVRQQLGDKGIVSIGYVFPLMTTKVWSDPYSIKERQETDQKSNGGRISWEQIWGTNTNLSFTKRKFKIDNELSGQNLMLSADEKKMLDRNGDKYETALSYDWLFSPGQVLHPEISFTRSALDGQAMSYDKITLSLLYGYHTPKWFVVTTALAGTIKYDENNPIYGKKADSNELGINATLFYHSIANIKELSAFVGASYIKSNSDIDFYSSYVKGVNTGLTYSF